MQIEKICQFCSKTYFVKPSRNEKTKYCSMKCLNTVNGRRNAKIRTEKCSSKEYLLSKIKIDKKTGCWMWQSGKNNDGYGGKRYKGKADRAHRVFYEIFIGKIPKGLFILHRCDRRACCNPSHLFTGTQRDNVQDMCKKKRNRPLAIEAVKKKNQM